MEAADHPSDGASAPIPVPQNVRASRFEPDHEPALHRLADTAVGFILLGLVVFTPWALGTTVPWAVGTLNAGGYALGGLWVLQRCLRGRGGYVRPSCETGAKRPWRIGLGVLTVLILAWCLTSAVNARAPAGGNGNGAGMVSGYVPWLPRSYDAAGSWRAFWMYLGLAATFWAARDWLTGLDPRERRQLERGTTRQDRAGASGLAPVPRRLELLLRVLGVNGALVALVALAQVMQGTDLLLGLFPDPLGRGGGAHFGPFPYRNNGAAFVNLLWPVCLAVWWLGRQGGHGSHRRVAQVGGSPRMLLVPAAVVMLACPAVFDSRGGTLVGVACAIALLALLGFTSGTHRLRTVAVGAAIVLAAGGLGAWLGWDRLKFRLLPHEWVLETGRDTLGDFSLACELDLVAWRPPYLLVRAGFSDSHTAAYGSPRSISLALQKSQSLDLAWMDDLGRAQTLASVPGFRSNYAGRAVCVVVVKRGSAGHIFVDGRLATGPPVSGSARAGAPLLVPARYLWAHAKSGPYNAYHDTIRRLTLFDRALSASEVATFSAAAAGNAAGREFVSGDLKPTLAVDLQRFSLSRWWRGMVADRRDLQELARRVCAAAPPFLGTGPGTFEGMFRVHPARPEALVDLRVHNDWLETRLTFGWGGFCLVLLALATALGMGLSRDGIPARDGLACFLAVSIAGCLLHAWQDFPLQNPAVLLVFLLLVCACSCLALQRPRITAL